MTDKVSLSAPTGDAATDSRTINAQAVEVQRMVELGNTTGAGTQVTVTNSSTSILSARDTRKAALLVNNQTVPVYIDPSGGSATTSMFRLDPGAAVVIPTTSAITGITSAAYSASGDAKVHVIETYDS